MQNEITESSELLDENGHLNQIGWAKKPILQYDKSKIKAPWYRIKEWDYYAIINEEFGLTITVAELGIMQFNAIVWLDFKEKKFYIKEDSKLLSRGKTPMPSSSTSGDIHIKTKNMKISFMKSNDSRTIKVFCKNFMKKRDLIAELIIQQDPNHESMVIATPWKRKPTKFYYNEKINHMSASGYVNIGTEEYSFDQKPSFGVLDWGRGNWTYKNRWYWGSASGVINNKLIGWNLGYGFSDRSSATENMIFYDGKVHKLDEIEFIFDSSNYLKPWRITSNDGRFEMDFKPILDRKSVVNLLVFKSDQHQVFGLHSGFFILDSGQKITITNMIGFNEDVYNRW